jgi:phosphoribosylformylglycinamidine synthase
MTDHPIEEEKLKRAILEIRDRRLGSGITDLGGGGLSSAIGERAHMAMCGAHVELSRVPLKSSGLAPWEIYISESQERMLFIVERGYEGDIAKVFQKYELPHAVIGKVMGGGVLSVKKDGVELATLPVSAVANAPVMRREAVKPERGD